MSVGENLRRYRKSRGMTQAQLESGEIDAWEYEGWKASL